MKKRILASVLSIILVAASVNVPVTELHAAEETAAAAESDADVSGETADETNLQEEKEADAPEGEAAEGPAEEVPGTEEASGDSTVGPGEKETSEEGASEEGTTEEETAEEGITEEAASEGTTEAETEKDAAEEAVTETFEMGEGSYEEVIDTSDLGSAGNEELLEGYLDSLLFGNSELTTAGSLGYKSLDGQTKTLYEQLKKLASRIAAGEEASAVVNMSGTVFLGSATYTYTAEDLGLSSLEDAGEVKKAVSNKINELLSFVPYDAIQALLQDCPYEMYWYDKTAGTAGGYGYKYGFSTDTVTVEASDITVYFKLNVSADYGTDTAYTVDTAKTSAISTAVNNAKSVVEKYAGEDDYTKLLSYRNEICDRTEYDYTAASGGVKYGNPWQFINVFDDDPSTKVVCEGYSKAFQYLCDLSSFSKNVYSYTVTGTMTATSSAGEHMWNVVHMENGKNYLADITNSDKVSPDAEHLRLFLVGASGSVSDGYVTSYDTVTGETSTYPGDKLTYTYDDDTLSYGESFLTLADADYVYRKNTDTGYAAQIGKEKYYDLDDAVQAARNAGTDNLTIKLLRDLDLADESLTIDFADGNQTAANTSITIDLNKHTITGTGNIFCINGSESAYGVLELAGTGTVSSTAEEGAVLCLQGRSALIIDKNVTVLSNSGNGITLSGEDVQQVEVDGTITAPAGYAIGGSSSAASPASGTITVNDGSVISAGDLIVGGKLYVNGGTFRIANGIKASKGGQVSITGGKFSFDPSAYAADGYAAVKNADGTYTVEKKVITLLVKTNGAGTVTPTEVTDLAPGDEVTLTVAPSEGCGLKSITVGNGKVPYEEKGDTVIITIPQDAPATINVEVVFAKCHLITYELNGGTNDTRNREEVFEGAKPTLFAPSRVGCTFAGWYTDEACKKAFRSGTAIKKDITVYAKWTYIPYDITYILNDDAASPASNNNNPKTYDVGTEDIDLQAPLRKGYVFAGWYDNADCSGETAGTIEINRENPETPVIRYAKWENPQSLGTVSGSLQYSCYNVKTGQYEWSAWTPAAVGKEEGNEVALTSEVPSGAKEVRFKLTSPAEDEGISVFYTTDGSKPDENSKLYQSPVTITADCKIRAIAVKNGCFSSKVSEWAITIQEPENNQRLNDDINTYCDGKVPDGLWIAGYNNTTVYTGSNITFPLRVYDHKTLLDSSQYRITYSNNKNACTGVIMSSRTPTIYVYGKGDYSSNGYIGFNIQPRDISELDAADLAVAYTKKNQKPVPSVRWESTILKANTDYTYSYYRTEKDADGKTKRDADGKFTAVGAEMTSVLEAGDYVVKIKGKGNYTGSKEINLQVVDAAAAGSAKLLSNVKVAALPTQYVKGYEQDTQKGGLKKDEEGQYIRLGYEPDDPVLTELFSKENAVTDGSTELKLGEQYVIGAVRNSEAPGTAVIVLNAIEGSGYVGTKEVKMTVRAVSGISIGAAKFTFVDANNKEVGKYSHEFTGTEIVPTVKLTYQGKKLTEEVDYIVSYAGNHVRAGTATMVITGIGAYTGTIKKQFTITPYDAEAKSVAGAGSGATTGASAASGDAASAAANGIEVSLAESSYLYVKGGVRPLPVVTFRYEENGETKRVTLTQGTDYKLSYVNDKYVCYEGDSVATAAVLSVELKGNYKGTVQKKYKIEPEELSQTTMVLSDVVYGTRMNSWKSKVVLKDTNGAALIAGTDYDSDPVYRYMYDAPGVKHVQGKVESTVDRHAGDPVDAYDLPPAGTVIKVTVKAGAIGFYTGTYTGTYRILSAGTDISRATVKISNTERKDGKYYYTGSPVCPGQGANLQDIKISFGKKVLTRDDYEIVGYTNNVKSGTATVTIRGKGNYGGIKTVQFKINKQAISGNLGINQP